MILNRKQFLSALADCGRAIKTNSLIGSCVRLKSTGVEFDLQLEIVATNIECTVTRLIEFKGEHLDHISDICIPHRKLLAVLESLQADTLTLTDGSNGIQIKAGRQQSTIRGLPAEDFPAIDSGRELELAILAPDLADGLEATYKLASAPEHGGRLVSVHVHSQAKLLSCFACDKGRRFSYFTRALIGEEKEMLIPAVFVPFLIPELKQEGAAIFGNENRIKVKHKSGGSSVKLMEGPYQNYANYLAPRQGQTGLLVPTEIIKRACTCALKLVSMNKNPAISLECTGNKLVVKSENSEDDYEDETEIENGLDFKFSMNAVYLLDVLSVLDAEKITVIALDGGVYFEHGDVIMAVSPLRGVVEVKEEMV